jgi:hypothetical protein
MKGSAQMVSGGIPMQRPSFVNSQSSPDPVVLLNCAESNQELDALRRPNQAGSQHLRGKLSGGKPAYVTISRRRCR